MNKRPKEEDGYKILKEGEIISSKDEVWSWGIGPWEIPTENRAGQEWHNYRFQPFRRKLPTTMNISEDGMVYYE